MSDSFCKFFNLDENRYKKNNYHIINFKSWFSDNENKPDDLELRVVFDDTNSVDNKYSNRTINVLWKGEFIGFISGFFKSVGIQRYRIYGELR